MKRLLLSLIILNSLLFGLVGQVNYSKKKSNREKGANKSLIIETNDIDFSKLGTSKVYSSGIIRFFDSKSKERGNAETTVSGLVKYYNTKSENLGVAEMKPTGDVYIYDKYNRRLGILVKPGNDWVNTAFWLYFYTL